ncbi:MAG: crossover junction endodeoxyribonuclease RuvC [Candidatus Pacebacteria bacterium]|nr:crossover junction endodeoxyribonuclease RuvC [Candidatus Paceibacterota bacterium]
MIILGIDPGSTRIGYGVILSKNGLSLIDYGTIEIKRKESGKLILEAAQKLSSLIKKYKPEIVGIEKLFFLKNVKTGIEVAQTRGALMLEIAKQNIPTKEYSPSEIKLTVAGYGLADKKAISKMVAISLNLKASELKGYDDATDALAVAITTAAHLKYAN